jgi:NAD(P)H dehydrogenase (quinone)
MNEAQFMTFLNSTRKADQPLTVLVVGATGQSAREVVFSLMQLDPSVRILAGVRDLAKGETLFGQHLSIEMIYLDTTKEETIAAAMQGVDRVVLISPIAQTTPQNNARVVQAAERASVGFIVCLQRFSNELATVLQLGCGV